MTDQPGSVVEPAATVQVVEIRKTCYACPAQWEGKTADGRWVYVRYRWGYLSVSVGDTLDEAVDLTRSGKVLYETRTGDSFNGYMDYAELRKLTEGTVQWPDKESKDGG